MRIGIDIRAAQLGSATRGIGKYIFDLVEGVARLAPEHEYVLIALPDKPLPEPLATLPACCRVALLPTPLQDWHPWMHPVPRVWRLRYLQNRRAHARALRQLARRERLDVLHLPSPMEERYFAVAGRASCKVIVTFLDAIPAVFPQEILAEWPATRAFVYGLNLNSVKEADIVVAISESARQDAIQYAHVPAGKLGVVYLTVSEEFHPVTDAARLQECRERLGIRAPYFLFCSAPDFTKNRERIIQAFAQFRDGWPEPYQLVFVTPKVEYAMTDVRRVAFDVGLDCRDLIYTGFVSDEELNCLYSGATALVSPSLYEGFGLPAGQAMRAGTPVIASDRSSQPEVVGDAGLLVDPYDVGAIAGAMRRLAGDAGLRAELSARGRERARLFDWQNQAQAMLNIYQGRPVPQPVAQELLSALGET